MGQLVTINDWASGPNGFKEPISRAALHKIAKTKQTYPPAIKQGRRWVWMKMLVLSVWSEKSIFRLEYLIQPAC
jgi:hypothetical protein